MVELDNREILDEKATLLVKGNKEWHHIHSWIVNFLWENYTIINHLVDGPNWAVEEAESRQDD